MTLQVARFHTCSKERHRIVDRTEVTERIWDSNAPNNRETLYFWGAVGVAAAVGGSVLLATTSDSDPNHTQLQVAGASLIGIGTAGALMPLFNEFRAIDSQTHVGEVEETQLEDSEECHSEPVRGVEVALVGNGGPIIRGLTDDRGLLVADISTNEIVRGGPVYHLDYGSVRLGETNKLASIYAAEVARKEGQARQVVVDQEAKSGRCTEARGAYMQSVLRGVTQWLDC